MLWIQNVTPGERPDNEPHDYVVRINREPPLGVFRHVRELGAAECLRAAANTIDGKPTPPAAVVEALERALRDMRSRFSPFPREDTEGWREEHEACEAADTALAALTAWRDAQ